MPRKVTTSLVRDIPADRVYNNVQVQRLINRVMRDGKSKLLSGLCTKAWKMPPRN